MRRVLLLPVAALVALVVAAQLTGTAAPRVSPAFGGASTAPVTDTTLVCPDVSAAPAGAATAAAITDVSRILVPPSTSSGSVTVAPLSRAAPLVIHPSPVTVIRPLAGQQQADSITASGSVAASVAADQVTLVPHGADRALLDSRCSPPGIDWWFVGADGRVGFTDTLLIANPASTTAEVAVTVLSSKGALSPPHLQAVRIPAAGRVALPMASVAPDVAVLAVHVQATSGAVTAAMVDRRTRGITPLGSDFLPSTATPTRSLVVPGFLGGAGTRQLVLADPGSVDATVNLRLVTASGAFVPAGTGQVVVRAGHTATVDVTKPFSGSTGAVTLSSDQPVVAEGISVVPSPGKLSDLQWQAAIPPLAATGAVADGTEPDGGHCLLLVTAPGAAATVSLRSSSGASRTIAVAAGHSAEVDVTSTVGGSARAPASFVVTPTAGGGPVYVTRSLTFAGAHGALVTSEPVFALPSPIRLPAVRMDPRLAVR